MLWGGHFAVWVLWDSGEDIGGLAIERVGGGEVGGVDTSPCVNYGDNFLRGHISEGGVVFGGESEDVAPAGDGTGLEEEGGNIVLVGFRMVVLLGFLDGGVVIDKGEGVFVGGVAVSLGTFVAGAEVALGVVRGEGVLGGGFLCSSTETVS